MKDLRIEFKFKNAVLLQRLREKFGEANFKVMSEAIGVSYTSLIYLLSLTHSPFAAAKGKKGRRLGAEINGVRYSENAMKIANFLDYSEPAELFPVSLYSLKLPKKYYKDFESIQILSLQEAAAQKLLPPVETYEDDVDQPMLRDNIASALSTLTVREEKVLRMRFGLDGEPEMSLDEVGEKFGIQKERIRQIEGKALRKLRHPARSNRLRPFHENDDHLVPPEAPPGLPEKRTHRLGPFGPPPKPDPGNGQG